MSEWRTIDSAPKDRMLLLFIPDAHSEKARIQTGSYGINSNGRRLWVIGGLFGFDVGKATHWMPLPEPPVTP
jgi:hypothetical protein